MVIWTSGRTYARLGGRTLLSVVRTYAGDHQMYGLSLHGGRTHP
jgi:hypothetical protein